MEVNQELQKKIFKLELAEVLLWLYPINLIGSYCPRGIKQNWPWDTAHCMVI